MTKKVHTKASHVVELHQARTAIKTLLRFVGEDPTREGLRDTPDRILRAWEEMLGGYSEDPARLMRVFKDAACDEMVVVRDISFTSFCEHHWLPFQGVAHVGYLPNKQVIGLSKIPRLVDCFARRLQVQERLTGEVAAALMSHLKPRGVGVVVEATHSCCSTRGVKKPGVKMTTSSMLGAFRKSAATRAEFLQLVRAK